MYNGNGDDDGNNDVNNHHNEMIITINDKNFAIFSLFHPQFYLLSTIICLWQKNKRFVALIIEKAMLWIPK